MHDNVLHLTPKFASILIIGNKITIEWKFKYPPGPSTATAGTTMNNRVQRWQTCLFSQKITDWNVNIKIKHIISHRQSLWMWSVGGLLALVYMTAANKLSLNFLIGLVWLIRPPCGVRMVTVTEWNQHPAKIWLGGFGLSKQIMVVGAGGTRNEWAESFVFPPYFSSIIHKQL